MADAATEKSIADLKQTVYDQGLAIDRLKDQINLDACFFYTQATFFHQQLADQRTEIEAVRQLAEMVPTHEHD